MIPPKYRRAARITKYAFLVLAGTAMFFAASAVLTSALGVMVYAWAVMMFAGGAVCILGAVTDWWLGEFVGTVPLFFVFSMFAIVFLYTGFADAVPARVAFGCIFASFAVWVLARFMDIWNLAASSRAVKGEQ